MRVREAVSDSKQDNAQNEEGDFTTGTQWYRSQGRRHRGKRQHVHSKYPALFHTPPK